MLLIVILLMCTLLLGYCWGKHNGRVEGYEQGIVSLPIRLREQSFEQGYCMLCNNQLTNEPSDY